MIDEKKLIEELERCASSYYPITSTLIEGIIAGFRKAIVQVEHQPKLSLETKTSDKDVPDNNVEKMNREFESLEVAYLPDEFCIYPEYIGKPYFAIRYKENGNHFVGYGTYSPEVLSRYLKDYFMPLAMPKESKWIPVHKHMWKKDANGEIDEYAWDSEFHNGPMCELCYSSPCIHCKPDWKTSECSETSYECSECQTHVKDMTNYCPHCGARMMPEAYKGE